MYNHNIATNDIPGAFLRTDIQGTFRVRLDGVLAEMFLNIDPEKYRDKVIIERGKKVIYEILKCAMCGAIINSLLFCRYLVMKLKSWGFHTNPYEPCAMNKVFYGNDCTICWHVYHSKISHVESTVSNDVLQCREEQYGKVAPLNTTLDNNHYYLGMALELITQVKVVLTMSKHIQIILYTTPTEMGGLTYNLADNHLFQVHEYGRDISAQ